MVRELCKIYHCNKEYCKQNYDYDDYFLNAGFDKYENYIQDKLMKQ